MPVSDLNTTDRELLEQVVAKIDTLYRTLIGEEELGHVGIVRRVALLEDQLALTAAERREGFQRAHERIDKVETRLNKLAWTAIGVGIGAGLGAGGLVSLLFKLLGG